MKISVTGHSKGIGKSLYDKLISSGNQVIGFSRSNGFDIQNAESRKRIIDQSKHCDIFVNNAWCESAQTLMLLDILECWKDTDKLIVNFSSKLSYLDETHTMYGIIRNHISYQNYIDDKKNQNNIVKSRIFDPMPKVMNLILGAVDTEMSKDLTCPKIEVDVISDFIINLIKLRDIIMIQEITIDHPHITTVK